MKYKKLVSGLLAVCVVSTMTLSVHAEDTRISIDGGNGSWHGGITDDGKTVYSKIWDQTLDHRAYKATVWVKDGFGKGAENPGQTYGLNELGELKVTCPARYNPLKKNTAGYKDLVVVDLNSRQAYLRDLTAPSSFEAEFELPNPAAMK